MKKISWINVCVASLIGLLVIGGGLYLYDNGYFEKEPQQYVVWWNSGNAPAFLSFEDVKEIATLANAGNSKSTAEAYRRTNDRIKEGKVQILKNGTLLHRTPNSPVKFGENVFREFYIPGSDKTCWLHDANLRPVREVKRVAKEISI